MKRGSKPLYGPAAHNVKTGMLPPAQLNWRDRRNAEMIYVEAWRLGLTVDHKTPRAGCKACGKTSKRWNAPDNLHLLTRAENSRKGQR